MKAGITVNGGHSYYRYGLRMLKRSIGAAPKDDYRERVPFSSVTYDFGSVCGRQSYGDRTLTYKLEFVCLHVKRAQDRVMSVLNWLHWTGRKQLSDSLYPDYHFSVSEPLVSVEENHGRYTFTAVFQAEPYIMPNRSKTYTADTVNFPDVNGDGRADGSDASVILNAYTRQLSGEDSGLTPAQEKLADANMDGIVDGSDATLVQRFYTLSLAGEYENTPAGWAEFLNDVKEKEKGVI